MKNLTNDQLDTLLNETINAERINPSAELTAKLDAIFAERKRRIEEGHKAERVANMTTQEAVKAAQDMAREYVREHLPASRIMAVVVMGTRAAVEVQTLSTKHPRVIMIRFASDAYGEKVSHRGGWVAQAQDFLSKAQ